MVAWVYNGWPTTNHISLQKLNKKALIRRRVRVGWSAPLLFVTNNVRVSWVAAHGHMNPYYVEAQASWPPPRYALGWNRYANQRETTESHSLCPELSCPLLELVLSLWYGQHNFHIMWFTLNGYKFNYARPWIQRGEGGPELHWTTTKYRVS